MSDHWHELKRQYFSTLQDYLAGTGEAALQKAYELGHKAVESGFGVLDIASIYRETLIAILQEVSASEKTLRRIKMATEFWIENLAPFEMTHRGFQEAYTKLRLVNKALEDEIAERMRYEEELRLRDRAIEAASAGIVITDARQPDNPIVYVNPAVTQVTGYVWNELIGRNPRIFQGPATDPKAVEKIRSALLAEQSCLTTLLNYKKDGTRFWNELFVSPVRDIQGNLTHFVGVQTNVTQLRQAEEEHHELEIARKIQLSLLPNSPLQLNGVFITGYCLPATHAGGDYFDYFCGPETIDTVIADVSGHSVGAALIMTVTRSTLKAEAFRRRLQIQHNGISSNPVMDAAEVVTELNKLLYDDLSRSEMFVSLFYLKFDPATRQLVYANAGHNSPLFLSARASNCTELDADGIVFGVTREFPFEQKTITLNQDDLVLLYTDGITEAQSPDGSFFGVDRLARLFVALRSKPPHEITRRIIDKLKQFCGCESFVDDVTLVVIKAIDKG